MSIRKGGLEWVHIFFVLTYIATKIVIYVLDLILKANFLSWNPAVSMIIIYFVISVGSFPSFLILFTAIDRSVWLKKWLGDSVEG